MSCLHLIKPLVKTARSLRLNVFPKRKFYDHCIEVKVKNSCIDPGAGSKPCKHVIPPRTRPKPEPMPQYAYKIKSMWEKPSCCVICEPNLAPIRHDLEFLEDIHWTKRRYQRTWYQCPDRCLLAGKCPPKKIKYVEPERRPRGVGNPDAKWITQLSECAKIEKFIKPCEPCKKQKLCIRPLPKCCRKRCTLYPSFSECQKPCPKVERPTECECLRPEGLCRVNEYYNERGIRAKDRK